MILARLTPGPPFLETRPEAEARSGAGRGSRTARDPQIVGIAPTSRSVSSSAGARCRRPAGTSRCRPPRGAGGRRDRRGQAAEVAVELLPLRSDAGEADAAKLGEEWVGAGDGVTGKRARPRGRRATTAAGRARAGPCRARGRGGCESSGSAGSFGMPCRPRSRTTSSGAGRDREVGALVRAREQVVDERREVAARRRPRRCPRPASRSPARACTRPRGGGRRRPRHTVTRAGCRRCSCSCRVSRRPGRHGRRRGSARARRVDRSGARAVRARDVPGSPGVLPPIRSTTTGALHQWLSRSSAHAGDGEGNGAGRGTAGVSSRFQAPRSSGVGLQIAPQRFGVLGASSRPAGASARASRAHA